MEELDLLEKRIENFTPLQRHDGYALEVIKEALRAAKSGTFGVGAVLVNKTTQQVEYRGHNRVFTESRSDLHAEMDLLNTFETQQGSASRNLLKDYSLFTSLESCPMCLCRIITAGVTEVYHLADDPDGGMVHLFDQLPPVWQEIAQGRIFKKAECSDELSAIAGQVFLLTVGLNEQLEQ
ncbi:MAG: hypothetical protein LBP91_01600 [Coriobacteriales bacterium]|jgi:cytosine deaminase|nr:hypothetical protein [Coriobacteriales bacterium]